MFRCLGGYLCCTPSNTSLYIFCALCLLGGPLCWAPSTLASCKFVINVRRELELHAFCGVYPWWSSGLPLPLYLALSLCVSYRYCCVGKWLLVLQPFLSNCERISQCHMVPGGSWLFEVNVFFNVRRVPVARLTPLVVIPCFSMAGGCLSCTPSMHFRFWGYWTESACVAPCLTV